MVRPVVRTGLERPGGVVSEWFTGPAAFDAVRADWDDLYARDPRNSPFLSSEWVEGWWREIGAPAGDQLRLLQIRRRQSVVGLAAFYERRVRGFRVIRAVGDRWVGSEYLGPVVRPAHRRLVWGEVMKAIGRHADVDGLMLTDLAPVPKKQVLGAGLVGHRVETDQAMPIVNLHGGWDIYLSRLSANMRSNIRRKLRKLVRAWPEMAVRTVESASALDEGLSTLFRLHRARWAQVGHPGNFDRTEVVRFHRRVAPALLSSGMLKLNILELEPGRPAAVLYSLRRGRHEYYLQSGRDPAFDHLALGFCLMGKVIRQAAEAGVETFDMLRGTERYKSHWSTAMARTERIFAGRGTPRGLIFAGRYGLEKGARAVVRSQVDRFRRARAARVSPA